METRLQVLEIHFIHRKIDKETFFKNLRQKVKIEAKIKSFSFSVEIQKDSADDTFSARVHKPWYGFYGLYDHFHVVKKFKQGVFRITTLLFRKWKKVL